MEMTTRRSAKSEHSSSLSSKLAVFLMRTMQRTESQMMRVTIKNFVRINSLVDRESVTIDFGLRI